MILLIGSTGLLGGQVLKRILDKKYPLKLCLRGSSDWKDTPVYDFKRRGVQSCNSDLTDFRSVGRCLEGCSAVINICGAMDPYDIDGMRFLHVEALENLLSVAKKKGVQRFIHISCLGARTDSESVYLHSKRESEELVRESSFYWTIFRPSYLFGETFPLLDLLMPVISFRPVLPLLGSGVNPVQPVWVENVADCIVDSIYSEDAVSKTFDLGGPDIYSMSDLMEIVRDELGMSTHSINIASTTIDKVSKFLEGVPKSPINKEVIKLIMAPSFTECNAIGTVFQTEPVSLEELLPSIIDSY